MPYPGCVASTQEPLRFTLLQKGSVAGGGDRGLRSQGGRKVSQLEASGRVVRPKDPLGSWFRTCLIKTE